MTSCDNTCKGLWDEGMGSTVPLFAALACVSSVKDIQLSTLSGLNQWTVFYLNRFGWKHVQSKKMFVYGQEMHKLFKE